MWILLLRFCTLGKIKKATKARSKTSEARRAGRRNWFKESATVSNEDRNFKQEMLVAMATIGYVEQIIFMKIIYSISARWRWFSSAKMIIIIIKLPKIYLSTRQFRERFREKHLGWLHTRQRVVNGLSVRRESFTSGQNEKPCFLRHNFIFFSNFFL